MPGKLVAEIVTLRSLHTIMQQVEADIATYSFKKEENSERLGNFLRDAEEKYGDEDWFKEFSLEKISGDKPKKDDSKKKSKRKKKKKGGSDSWVPFKSLELSSSVQGEAEIMFETLQAITEKLEALEESKESIEELRNVGLGNEVVYISRSLRTTWASRRPTSWNSLSRTPRLLSSEFVHGCSQEYPRDVVYQVLL